MNINTLFQIKPERKKIARENPAPRKEEPRQSSPSKNKHINYLENPDHQNIATDIKYNLSFSEEFASYYSPQVEEIPDIQEKRIQQKFT